MPQFEVKCEAGHTNILIQSFRPEVAPKLVNYRTAQSLIPRIEAGQDAMVFYQCFTCGGHAKRCDVPASYLPPTGTPRF